MIGRLLLKVRSNTLNLLTRDREVDSSKNTPSSVATPRKGRMPKTNLLLDHQSGNQH